jgi:eukaryotic-like serine/threonine-protein kinase
MGTAGYMSPEQARGEKLDARTDLFSLGLVLFEMATGKRVFHGDTGPKLHAAILSQTPTSARKLNPKVPAKLDAIIRKLLEKQREKRYQSAAELRSDLEILKRDILPNAMAVRWWATAVVVLALVVVVAVFWNTKRPPSIVPDLKLQQLTFNSSGNPATGGAISPNGKYLAYADAKGMHIKPVGTEETRSVPQPEAFTNDSVNWDFRSLSTAWFPDSTKFLANAHPASENSDDWSSQTSGMWLVSVQGGAPRKVRDRAVAWAVSPDGHKISFGVNTGKLGERELWLMQPDGEQALKLFDTDENSEIGPTFW